MEKAAKAIVDLVDPYITCDGEWDTKERAIADIATLLATVQSEREKALREAMGKAVVMSIANGKSVRVPVDLWGELVRQIVDLRRHAMRER